MDGVYVAQETERETKQQPSMLPGPPVPGWCLVSFRFLCDIHSIHSVNFLCTSPIAMSTNGCPRPDVPPCIREGRESALIIVSIVRTSLTQITNREMCRWIVCRLYSIDAEHSSTRGMNKLLWHWRGLLTVWWRFTGCGCRMSHRKWTNGPHRTTQE